MNNRTILKSNGIINVDKKEVFASEKESCRRDFKIWNKWFFNNKWTREDSKQV